jgi:hypothetical protein
MNLFWEKYFKIRSILNKKYITFIFYSLSHKILSNAIVFYVLLQTPNKIWLEWYSGITYTRLRYFIFDTIQYSIVQNMILFLFPIFLCMVIIQTFCHFITTNLFVWNSFFHIINSKRIFKLISYSNISLKMGQTFYSTKIESIFWQSFGKFQAILHLRESIADYLNENIWNYS